MGKEILCVALLDDGKLIKSSFEILTLAKKIKDAVGSDKISVAVPSDDPAKFSAELFAYGADKVYGLKSSSLNHYRTQPFSIAITELAKKITPDFILIPGTGNGRDLAPYLGVKLCAGVIADVIDAEKVDGGVQFTRPCFVGNLLYTGKFNSDNVKIMSVRPKAFALPEKAEGKSGEYVEEAIAINEDSIPVRVLEVSRETGKISLQDADFIITGGRGVGAPEKFAELNELADILGGAVGASRAVVDAGWISYDHQVGQTGKTVKPKIYFAFGVSGAIQHLAGMRTSDVIIGVNVDKEAPIFKVATYGINEDMFKILPVLKNELKKRLVK